jgi:2-dehydropantoate 2-reductase
MRVLVMGAGGVGGHYGGALQAAGHSVTFVARGTHLDALRERGLDLRIGEHRLHLMPVDATDTPPAGRSFDLVLFTVKTYDTAAAIEALRPAIGPTTAVLTLQNGVESSDVLAAAFGADRVVAGTTVMTSMVVAPGVIEAAAMRVLVLAELDRPPSPRLARLADAFRDIGADVTVVPDASQAIWEKFVLLAPLATLTSACGQPVGVVREDPESAALLRQLMSEVANLGRARGVPLGPDVEEHAWRRLEAAPASAKTSMQADFEAGRRVELEQITGAVVKLARERGLAAPAFEALYPVLRLRSSGAR